MLLFFRWLRFLWHSLPRTHRLLLPPFLSMPHLSWEARVSCLGKLIFSNSWLRRLGTWSTSLSSSSSFPKIYSNPAPQPPNTIFQDDPSFVIQGTSMVQLFMLSLTVKFLKFKLTVPPRLCCLHFLYLILQSQS